MLVSFRTLFFAAAIGLSGFSVGCASTIPEPGRKTAAVLQELDEKKASRTIRFDCQGDPLAGSLSIFNGSSGIRALLYKAGYSHGARIWRFRLKDERVTGAFLVTSGWSFDPDVQRVRNPATIESLRQELYIYKESRFFQAYDRSARAYTRKGEKVDSKIAAESFQPLTKADSKQVEGHAAYILKNLKAGKINKNWCGIPARD